MKSNIVTTIRGAWNTSIQILQDKALRAGDIVDMSNITHMVPEGISFTSFFNAYVKFCTSNGNCKQFRINEVKLDNNGYELWVSPAI